MKTCRLNEIAEGVANGDGHEPDTAERGARALAGGAHDTDSLSPGAHDDAESAPDDTLAGAGDGGCGYVASVLDDSRLSPTTAQQPSMPAKDASTPRRRKDSVDKKLLKGLQIFKRSKSKQSLGSTPSLSAASADGSIASDDPTGVSFTEAHDPTNTNESPMNETTSQLGSTNEHVTSPAVAVDTQRKRSTTGISLSRIVGEVTESESVAGTERPAGGAGAATQSSAAADTAPAAATCAGLDDSSALADKLQRLQTGQELDRKIAEMKAERQRRQDENVSEIIEALILEKMQGMERLNNSQTQMTDGGAEPVVTLPDSPLTNGPAGALNSKMGPLAKFSTNVPSSHDTPNTQVTSNAATRVAKRSQVLQAHSTASTTSELKASISSHGSTTASSSVTQAHNYNRKLSQTQISSSSSGLEMSRLTSGSKIPTAAGAAQAASAQAVKALQAKGITAISSEKDVRQLADSFDKLKDLRSMDRLADSLSMENLANGDLLPMDMANKAQNGGGAGAQSNVNVFEQKQSYSSSNKKTVTNDFSTEEATANSEQMTRLQQGDHSFSENKASSDVRARLHMDGVTAEKGISTRQEERHLRAGDLTHDESRTAAVAGAKLSTADFSTERVAMAEDAQRHTVASGVVNSEQHSSASTHSRVTISQQQAHVATPTSPAVAQAVDELDRLERTTNPLDVSRALNRCSQQASQLLRDFGSSQLQQRESVIDQMDVMLQRAWRVPAYGRELGTSLSDVIRNSGGLDVLMKTCNTGSKEMDLKTARVLGQCLTTTNRAYVVERGLNNVVESACRTCSDQADEEESRVGSGILENLFKHNEGTCSDVVRLGGLDAVITQCRKKDVQTLRHCASALANLSLYGGPENQEAMIKRKVPTWLFPLAFHNDDNIKYYACLAIASMVANQQIEAAVLKSGTLELVDPFVTTHDPDTFSKQAHTHLTGHSKNWLQRLVPILFSKREEARKLAAFHFCMEAGAKVREGCPEVFQEIGAIEPLKQVASSPNAIASKYAAQALRLLGQEVPHKLSQQVPVWSVQDVREWVKQIEFGEFAEAFERSRVDGDLLLRMTEAMLRDDIGITNGILRTRFLRELNTLKRLADYTSCDSTGLNAFLQSVNPELSVYTYPMLASGIDRDYLRCLTDEQLLHECNIFNSIHRLRIHQAIKQEIAPPEPPDDLSKTLDCFISYRRSNGSQLASLLKVHLELRGFSVFIDVERLEAGKFDNNLLNSIRQAQNFILVLTQSALDRCINDYEQKDWIHKETCAALQAKCNIIPIIDNFQWPETEDLPEDMQAITKFNGIHWIHDYQDACVDKLERFIRGEADRPELRTSPGLRGYSPYFRPIASRGASPGRITPVGSPLARRARRYQPQPRAASPAPASSSVAAMHRSRSVDAMLDQTQTLTPHLIDTTNSSQAGHYSATAGTTGTDTQALRQDAELENGEGGMEDSQRRSSEELTANGAPARTKKRGGYLRLERQTTMEDDTGSNVDKNATEEKQPCGNNSVVVTNVSSPSKTVDRKTGPPSGRSVASENKGSLKRSTGKLPGRRANPPALMLIAPSQDDPNQTPVSLKSPPIGGRHSPVARRIRRRSEQSAASAPNTPSSPSDSADLSSPGGAGRTNGADISRQNRMRKSNVVERAFTKMRTAMTKENK